MDALGYQELAEEIIKHESSTLGVQNAVKLARKVDSLEISDDGEVTDFSGDKKTIEELAGVYINKLGTPAKVSIRANVASKFNELDLPESLS